MYIHLKNRALLKISGSDSESFLQAQLSNDINKLDQKSIQAYLLKHFLVHFLLD